MSKHLPQFDMEVLFYSFKVARMEACLSVARYVYCI